MYTVYIPAMRLKLLKQDNDKLERISRACDCELTINDDNSIEISGDAYNEYNAKAIVLAFGAGFDIETSLLLLNESYYFDSIDLEPLFRNKKRLEEVKARIIGINGKTKRYIESVSSAKVSIYGDSVSIIGNISQVGEADTAIKALINGSNHKRAYSRMEAKHRKHKSERFG
jgi:ribosomal RNA assembly protein